MRVLVCGGRDFDNQEYLFGMLDRLHKGLDITCLINGGARGADSLAAKWAHRNGIEIETYQARWDLYGPSAGPKRNRIMFDEGQPDFIVAFRGGKGTEDMCQYAMSKGKIPMRF